jgi:hypothetical protein
MNRLSAGAITGLVGAVLLILLAFVQVPFVAILVPILVGIGAGVLVARNPQFAGKTGGAGALAGLFAGAFLFVASLVTGVILLNTNNDTINQTINSISATVTAQAAQNGTSSSNAPDLTTLVRGAIFVGLCIAGLLYLGLSTGLGAAAGAIAGRNNQAAAVPPSLYGVPPQGGYGAPPAGYPPQPGYPPPAQPGYGAQQPPPPIYNPPPQAPTNDGTQ